MHFANPFFCYVSPAIDQTFKGYNRNMMLKKGLRRDVTGPALVPGALRSEPRNTSGSVAPTSPSKPRILRHLSSMLSWALLPHHTPDRRISVFNTF
jgi:hypothetical protein